MDRASPFKHWHSASIASSSSGVWVWPFFPALLVFLAEGAVIILQDHQVWGGFTFVGSWPLAHPPCRRGVHHPTRWEDVFPGLFPQCFEPEVEALLEGCEIRLARARFRRLAIESSWSPKESTGPVDFPALLFQLVCLIIFFSSSIVPPE